MLIIVACQFVAHKVRVASPLILLVVGLAIGFLPQVGAIEIEPHIVLEMVLPPLLFSAAVRMPTMDFRREMQAVAMLAIPLVFLSAFAVGFVINWLVPAISLPWGVALGAVLSPTDAVAISIAKRSGVSHRIITVLVNWERGLCHTLSTQTRDTMTTHERTAGICRFTTPHKENHACLRSRSTRIPLGNPYSLPQTCCRTSGWDYRPLHRNPG
nr:cation:proton antiporter [Rothia sp. RSM482]